MAGSPDLWREMKAMAVAQSCPLACSRVRGEGILAAALEGLPERTRLMIALRWYEGLGPDELGAVLRLPREEVDREMGEALSRLYRTLHREPGCEEANENR